jgi:4-diphosphocytidyl-2-C-methyl-D-erythritol kinase
MERKPVTHWNWQSTWPAPAKLNLFLHIIGRRDDGYHLLQTVFQFIDRADQLRFEPRTDGQIILATPIPGVPPDTDLTVRAARLLQQTSGCTLGATIHLEKNLPMGGGLGGGSSDAATVLLALNQLWKTGLTRPMLEKIGLQLGADVPVFIHGKNTFAEGIGETFTDLELPAATFLVLHPAVNVPTAAIFSSPELKRDTPAINPANWQPGTGHNDLEAVACKIFPAVGEALAVLKQNAPQAMMTGSGACVFAAFPERSTAEAVLAQIPPTLNGWLAESLSQHPLATL